MKSYMCLWFYLLRNSLQIYRRENIWNQVVVTKRHFISSTLSRKSHVIFGTTKPKQANVVSGLLSFAYGS
jgi:hypothetical protein